MIKYDIHVYKLYPTRFQLNDIPLLRRNGERNEEQKEMNGIERKNRMEWKGMKCPLSPKVVSNKRDWTARVLESHRRR